MRTPFKRAKKIRSRKSRNAFAWPYFYAVTITNSVQNDWWYYPLAILSMKSEYDTTPRENDRKRRSAYPVGTRVELVRMEDMQAPPIGTQGTVIGVDDTASVMVAWDNGSGLNVIYGEDAIRKVGDHD